jgi:hypothetical protein
VSIIEHQLIRVLCETGGLLRAGLVEAFLFDFYVQTAREHDGALVQLVGLALRRLPHRGKIFFQTGSIETCLMKVLHGAHESSRLAPHGGTQCGETTAGFGR